jgi:hypothetical protein
MIEEDVVVAFPAIGSEASTRRSWKQLVESFDVTSPRALSDLLDKDPTVFAVYEAYRDRRRDWIKVRRVSPNSRITKPHVHHAKQLAERKKEKQEPRAMYFQIHQLVSGLDKQSAWEGNAQWV